MPPKHVPADNPPPPPVSQPQAQTSFDARVSQCRKELQVMQSYNVSVYQQYNQRFERANGQMEKYLEIRDKVGSDIDDIATPKYQYNVRRVCEEIRSSLMQLIIKEV
ncbi:hypothetical protein [Erwinia sorbitola]|uniref:Uncharacterized protein n=1 Tax=Erwinia sorbitola TaxID=2681984 RepID=A0A6I6EQZ1_9GAMM|nr:hypothetical protein [Erwinia sorbitola]MTD25950.1 hypothetical protein [Erwinia sorbitola]QGU87509.1 hypothetical protein GN242_09870 [Erwinia sorbitola]